jgi:hypothetical protein
MSLNAERVLQLIVGAEGPFEPLTVGSRDRHQYGGHEPACIRCRRPRAREADIIKAL